MDFEIGWLDAVLAIVVALITWRITSAIETARRERERLKEQQRSIYMAVLDPYIRMLAGIDDPSRIAKAMKKVQSYEYRRTTYEFMLLGSDEATRALNRMMQYFFKRHDEGQGSDGIPNAKLVELWGGLLLAFRRDLGFKRTRLDEVEMLKSHITDIEEHLGKAKESDSQSNSD